MYVRMYARTALEKLFSLVSLYSLYPRYGHENISLLDQLLRRNLHEIQVILAHEALPLLMRDSLQTKLEEGHLLCQKPSQENID